MQSNEVETIEGFDIPKRQLTDEEKTREITLERFNDFVLVYDFLTRF